MVDLTPIPEATTDFLALYRRAFDAFGASALWNKTRIENPSPGHALVIARALRIEGDKRVRQLAEDIEHASGPRPVPLSSLQTEALQLLGGARDPESYVADSTPLNVSSERYSADIDIFHDRAERVATQALSDASLLTGAGFTVTWAEADGLHPCGDERQRRGADKARMGRR